jgi:hypothetical protein
MLAFKPKKEKWPIDPGVPAVLAFDDNLGVIYATL